MPTERREEPVPPSSQQIEILLVGSNCCSVDGFGMQANNFWCDLRGYGSAIHDSDFEQRVNLTVDGREAFLAMAGVLRDDQLRVNMLRPRFSTNPVEVLILIYDVTSRDDFEFMSRAYRTVLISELSDGISPAIMSVPMGPPNAMGRSVHEHEGNSKRPLRGLGTLARRRKERAASEVAPVIRVARSTGLPGLPLELQLAFLRACLTSPMPITDHNLHRHGIDLNVLQVCRLFHDEGTRIFWNENTFATSRQVYLIADLTWVTPQNQPVVTTAEGRTLAKDFDCKFFESSSRIHDDVEPILTELVRENRARNKFRSACASSSRQRFADVENTKQQNHSAQRTPRRRVSLPVRCWRYVTTVQGIWRQRLAARSNVGRNKLDSRHISTQK